MNENMKSFLAKVSQDKALAESLSKLDKAGLIAAAKELGFELTDADFVPQEGELSEKELSGVTGGGKCGCIGGGGGTRGGDDKVCACIFGGWGDGTDGKTRCTCALLGNGEIETLYI